MKHTFNFISNKDITTIYFLKENELYLEINIKVISISIDKNKITITYLVKDSNNKYEYKIEMSDL